MEALRYIIFFYSFIGILVAGGLLFNQKNKSQLFLAIFVLMFSLEQLDFLYSTSSLIPEHGKFYYVFFPNCLLFGPSFYFHIKYLNGRKINWPGIIPHSLPFVLFVGYTVFLFTFPYPERIDYISKNYWNQIMPTNYMKAAHVLIYGIAAIICLQKESFQWPKQQKTYAKVMVGIYGTTALLQALFTLFAHNYAPYLFYFASASTLVLFVAYILFYRPEVFEKIQQKYFYSTLSQEDKQRIADKIKGFLQAPSVLTQPQLKLDTLCQSIDEKKHHVSQTLSEEFESSFNDLINSHRIEHAKAMLSNPDFDHLKILAVALESGFSNKNTFNRAFVKFTQKTPGVYRKENR